MPSLEYHRIHRKLSVVVGGAALAADNLNAYVPGMGLAFDADVILPDDELLAWQQEYAGVLQDEKPPDILRVGCMRQSYNPLQQEIAPSIYNAMLARAVPPTDTFPYARLQAADAAYTKVFRGDPKDIVGLIQAHRGAYRTNHPVLANPAWQTAVGRAVGMAPQVLAEDVWVPKWFHRHVQDGFNHAAFAAVRAAEAPRST